MRALLTRIAAWAVERPAAVGALTLEADRDPSSLVDRDSEAFGATEDFYARFGDEPVRILVEGDLRKLVLDSKNLNTMLGLEACLAGRSSGRASPRPPSALGWRRTSRRRSSSARRRS